MESEKKTYTLADVSQHNNSKDCWLIISGKVYNVTKFLEDHPGGDEVLLSATGKDATDDFEDVGHSTSARATMDEFYVGDIDSSTVPPRLNTHHQSSRTTTRTKHPISLSSSSSSWFRWLFWVWLLVFVSTISHQLDINN